MTARFCWVAGLIAFMLLSWVTATDFSLKYHPVNFGGDVITEREGDRIRISLSESFLLSLPEAPSEEDFDTPDPFYRTANIDWNPHGHAPEPVWGYPHFDFHFYTVTQQVRALAQCSFFPPCVEDATSAALFAPIDPLFYPEDYFILQSSATPNMGVHVEWRDDPQWGEEPPVWETATFFYGFIGGKLSFLEPMVTLALLQSKKTWIQPVHPPQMYSKEGFWPTEYRVYFNETTHRHVVELAGLVHREEGEFCCQGNYALQVQLSLLVVFSCLVAFLSVTVFV